MAYKDQDGDEWASEEEYKDYLVRLDAIRKRNKLYQEKLTKAVKKHWKIASK